MSLWTRRLHTLLAVCIASLQRNVSPVQLTVQASCAAQRFGVEGCEAILAGADALLARCAVHGTRRVELGMAHRGRLAMLSTLLNKPPGTLFAKMENAQSDYAVGDVTYHLGETATLTYTQVLAPQLAGHSLRDSADHACACLSKSAPPG